MLCYIFCAVHWADLIYVSLLIIFCIIEYVTNKKPWDQSASADYLLELSVCWASSRDVVSVCDYCNETWSFENKPWVDDVRLKEFLTRKKGNESLKGTVHPKTVSNLYDFLICGTQRRYFEDCWGPNNLELVLLMTMMNLFLHLKCLRIVVWLGFYMEGNMKRHLQPNNVKYLRVWFNN